MNEFELYQAYEQRKSEWRNDNHDATHEQYQAAMSAIAEELGI